MFLIYHWQRWRHAVKPRQGTMFWTRNGIKIESWYLGWQHIVQYYSELVYDRRHYAKTADNILVWQLIDVNDFFVH